MLDRDVLNSEMRFRVGRVLASALTLLVLASAASAKSVELGQTSTPLVAPSCPANVALKDCNILLEHTTAIQTKSDGAANPARVKQAGWIVAFTVGLSDLVSNPTQEHNLLKSLNEQFGGTPQLVLSVLRPTTSNTYRVVAQSETYHVTPFLGQVVEEPLSPPDTLTGFTALPVNKGDVIGLTTPTWAPVLAINLDSTKFGYRQSRRTNCTHAPATQTALTMVDQSAPFRCVYTSTRVEYSATEIVNVHFPKKYVH